VPEPKACSTLYFGAAQADLARSSVPTMRKKGWIRIGLSWLGMDKLLVGEQPKSGADASGLPAGLKIAPKSGKNTKKSAGTGLPKLPHPPFVVP
jgi:hypothetical protein